jgi:HEAT repeat protein
MTRPSAEITSPAAFVSYAHYDDREEEITVLCQRLADEMRAQTGRPFAIFKDNDDIGLGEDWRRRIDEGLATAAFLIPIVTPSFLMSPYCRQELETFLERERVVERHDSVLPIYYIDCSDYLEGTQSDPAATALRTILERQFDDWRDVRHLPLSEPEGKRRVAALAEKVRAAVKRREIETDEPEQAPSRAESAPETPPAEPRAGTPRTADTLLDALVDRDPVTSRPAAAALVERGPDVIPAAVERLRDVPTSAVPGIRDLLVQFPTTSGPLMVARIKAADRDWGAATDAPKFLAPAHASVCEEELAAMVEQSFTRIDAVRKSIEALGYLGAVDYGYRIWTLLRDTDDDFDDDLYGKYSSYCVEALARIVTLTRLLPQFRARVDGAFDQLEPAIELMGRRGWQSIVFPTLQSILTHCHAHHADRLIAWLRSPNEDLRNLGSYALGGIPSRRAISPLLARAADTSETAVVRKTSIFAVGVIGGPEAVTGLATLELDGALAARRDWALGMCAADAASDQEFEEVCVQVLAGDAEEKGWAYRAIGRRPYPAMSGAVRSAVLESDTAARGDAVLALARIAGPQERTTLMQAYREATSTRERMLACLGLLQIGQAPPDDPELLELRDILAAEALMYRAATHRDILDVLRGSDVPAAPRIADAWEPLFATASAY